MIEERCCDHKQCASSIIDISTPDTLQRDFTNWLNGMDISTSYHDTAPNSVSDAENDKKNRTFSFSSTSASSPSSPSSSPVSSSSTDGRKNRKKGTNLYGRPYCPGRPLSMEERTRIIELHGSGMKVNAISKSLCISHGCVSKIISRFRTTGVLLPACSPEQRKTRKQKIREQTTSFLPSYTHDANGNFNCTHYSVNYSFSNSLPPETSVPPIYEYII